jgi:hypothetical protein
MNSRADFHRSSERFTLSSVNKTTFPQPPLLVPKSLVGIKTPATDPDTIASGQVATNKVQTTTEMTVKATKQLATGSIHLKA